MGFTIGVLVGMVAGLVSGICLMWEQREIEFESRRDAADKASDNIETRARGVQ